MLCYETMHQVSNCSWFFCFWVYFGCRIRSKKVGRRTFLWAPVSLLWGLVALNYLLTCVLFHQNLNLSKEDVCLFFFILVSSVLEYVPSYLKSPRLASGCYTPWGLFSQLLVLPQFSCNHFFLPKHKMLVVLKSFSQFFWVFIPSLNESLSIYSQYDGNLPNTFAPRSLFKALDPSIQAAFWLAGHGPLEAYTFEANSHCPLFLLFYIQCFGPHWMGSWVT